MHADASVTTALVKSLSLNVPLVPSLRRIRLSSLAYPVRPPNYSWFATGVLVEKLLAPGRWRLVDIKDLGLFKVAMNIRPPKPIMAEPDSIANQLEKPFPHCAPECSPMVISLLDNSLASSFLDPCCISKSPGNTKMTITPPVAPTIEKTCKKIADCKTARASGYLLVRHQVMGYYHSKICDQQGSQQRYTKQRQSYSRMPLIDVLVVP